MIDLLDRRDLRGATLLLVSCGAVACAKLNAAYAPAGEGATSGAPVDGAPDSMVDGVTSDASAGSGRPGGTSDGEPDPEPGPMTNASETNADTGGGEGPDESSGDEGSSSGDERPPVWNPSCALALDDVFCPGTLAVGPDATCGLGPFLSDGEVDCDRANTASVFLDFAPGIYVFGTLPDLGAELLVDDGESAPVCAPSFAGLAVESPTLVEVVVRTNEELVDVFAVRDATDLCEVPEDCCEESNVGAAEACSDAGLWGCVTFHDPFCVEAWDPICVQTAVLFCGADCEQAIQTAR